MTDPSFPSTDLFRWRTRRTPTRPHCSPTEPEMHRPGSSFLRLPPVSHARPLPAHTPALRRDPLHHLPFPSPLLPLASAPAPHPRARLPLPSLHARLRTFPTLPTTTDRRSTTSTSSHCSSTSTTRSIRNDDTQVPRWLYDATMARRHFLRSRRTFLETRDADAKRRPPHRYVSFSSFSSFFPCFFLFLAREM